jgi:hypothetical protein
LTGIAASSTQRRELLLRSAPFSIPNDPISAMACSAYVRNLVHSGRS